MTKFLIHFGENFTDRISIAKIGKTFLTLKESSVQHLMMRRDGYLLNPDRFTFPKDYLYLDLKRETICGKEIVFNGYLILFLELVHSRWSGN